MAKATAISRKHFGLTVYRVGSEEYAVGTDDEADKAARQAVQRSLWTISTSLIMEFLAARRLDLSSRDYSRLKSGLEEAQTKLSEDANDLIEGLIGEKHLGEFCDSVIQGQGRGGLLSAEDGSEKRSERVPGLPKGKYAYKVG